MTWDKPIPRKDNNSHKSTKLIMVLALQKTGKALQPFSTTLRAKWLINLVVKPKNRGWN
jgi:hypothetical protein